MKPKTSQVIHLATLFLICSIYQHTQGSAHALSPRAIWLREMVQAGDGASREPPRGDRYPSPCGTWLREAAMERRYSSGPLDRTVSAAGSLRKTR